jgi:hypothetical protein
MLPLNPVGECGLSDAAAVSVWDDVKPLDVAALRDAYQAATPTHFFHVDGFLHDSFAEEVRRAYPSYEEALRLGGNEFRAMRENQKIQVSDPQRFPEPVRRLNEVLQAPAFLRTLCEITGIEGLLADVGLAGGGMHVMGPRGRLDVHVDFNLLRTEPPLHRRLNILLFLNAPWEEAWRGEIELWNPDVSKRVQAFAPVHNRCVVFNTTERSFHGVAPLRCPPGTTRNSFAAYYYTEAAPEAWDGTRHTTQFKPRPSERLRYATLGRLDRLRREVRKRLAR